MGYGRGKGSDMNTDNCISASVLILNLFCGILGLLVFGLAVFFRFEGQVRDWVNDLEMNQYWTGLYILMGASLIVVFISIFGCIGVLTANGCLLATKVSLTSVSLVMLLMGSIILLSNFTRHNMDLEETETLMNALLNQDRDLSDEFLVFLYYGSAILILAALILELAGGIYLVVHGTQNSKLQPWLDNRIDILIRDSNYNQDANRLLTVIQENVGCCGSYNYQDYDRSRLPIPDSCRDKVSGNVYQEGCVEKFTYFMEKRAGWIAGIAIFIGFMQLFLMCLTFVFWRRTQEDDGTRTNYSYHAANKHPTL